MICWSQESEDPAAFYKDKNRPQLEILRNTRDIMLTRQRIADKRNNLSGKEMKNMLKLKNGDNSE